MLESIASSTSSSTTILGLGHPKTKPSGPVSLVDPGGLDFLADATTYYVTVDQEWLFVLENPDSRKAVLHGRRIYEKPKGFAKYATWIIGKHMRKFEVKIEEGNPMLIVTRPISTPYWLGWIFCCGEFGNKIHVTLADGTKVGSIVQKWGFPKVRYNVLDQKNKLAMVISPPIIGSLNGCNPNVTFKVKFMFPVQRDSKSLDDTNNKDSKKKKSKGVVEPMGYIKKCYSECFYEIFTDSRNYKIDLPIGLPFQMKTLLFSSVFLLHAIYFERG